MKAPAFNPHPWVTALAQISVLLDVVGGGKHMPASVGNQGVKLGIAGLNWHISLRILSWPVPVSDPSQSTLGFSYAKYSTEIHKLQMAFRVYTSYYKVIIGLKL